MLLAIGLPHEVAHGSLRLSLSDYNTTEEDVDYIFEVLPEVVERSAGHVSRCGNEIEQRARRSKRYIGKESDDYGYIAEKVMDHFCQPQKRG